MFSNKTVSCIIFMGALSFADPSLAQLKTKQDFDQLNSAWGTIAGWTIQAQLYGQIRGSLSNMEKLIADTLKNLKANGHATDGLLLDVKIGYHSSGYGVFQGIEFIGTGRTPICAYFSMYKTGSIRPNYPQPTDPDASYMVWVTINDIPQGSSGISISEVAFRRAVISGGIAASDSDCLSRTSDITPPLAPQNLSIE